MTINVGILVIYIFLIIAVIVMIPFIIDFSNKYNTCRTEQSPFCFSITCPGPINPDDLCFGYAQRGPFVQNPNTPGQTGQPSCALSGVSAFAGFTGASGSSSSI